MSCYFTCLVSYSKNLEVQFDSSDDLRKIFFFASRGGETFFATFFAVVVIVSGGVINKQKSLISIIEIRFWHHLKKDSLREPTSDE